MNIAVVFGGISTERNVSIAGGMAVVEALRSKGHNAAAVDPAFGAEGKLTDAELAQPEAFPTLDELSKFSPRKYIECINSEIFDNIDAAFLVLHGKYGEDGMIQALLSLRGIPYTGSGVKSSALAMDKLHSKLLFTAAGVPTPAWAAVRKNNFDNYDYFEEIRTELGNHIVIKPNDQGSTIGVTIIESGNLDDIHDAVREAAKYSELVVVEEFIKGRELTVAIVGEEVYPIIEIIPGEEGFYDYKHKYTKGQTQYQCPAEISGDIAEFTQHMADLAYRTLGCSGFGRVDFRLNEDGQPFCLEVNTIPGFTKTSLVPMAALATGLEFSDLCEKIIDIAIENGSHTEAESHD